MAEPGSLEALRERYLGIVERALTHTLYEGIDAEEVPRELAKEWISAIVEAGQAELVFDPERTRAEGRDWPRFAQTMVGSKRLRNVRRCTERVIAEGIPGDLIETGVWRGGTAIMMRAVLEAYGDQGRRVWLADSFQGLPPPDAASFPADEGDRAHEFEHLAVSADEVRANFARYGFGDERLRFVEGWFRDTLPPLRGRRWALLRLDGDMYESTAIALDCLYDGLEPGGFVIVDDFALPPCRAAVEDFRARRAIDDPIEEIDWTGVFWRKTA